MAERPTSAVWAELRSRRPITEDALATTAITAGGIDTPLLLAIDVAGSLHLLIPVDHGPTGTRLPDLNGLKVRHRRLEIGEFLDLVAAPAHEQVFTPVCTDIIHAIIEEQRSPWPAVSAIIRSWQSAWKPARQEMDKTVQVGLFGELVVLETLMIPCIGSAAVGQWSGPEFERHDFVGEELHIEVKTTRKSRHEHEISRLDQLRTPAGCRLLLVSLQLEQSVGGNESLATRIDSIIDLLRSDAGALDNFITKIVNMGWSDEIRNSGEMLRFFIREAFVYMVDEDFPRLPDDFDLPSGVVSVKYTVDLANLPALGFDEAIEIIREDNLCYLN
jgi:hypothetical protein